MKKLFGKAMDALEITGGAIVKTLTKASSGVGKAFSLLRKHSVYALAAIILVFAGTLISGGAATAETTVASTSVQQVQLFQGTQSGVKTVLPAAPAINEAQASPKQWAERAQAASDLPSACEYLTFCRWFGVSSLPTPTIGLTSMAQLPALFSAQIGQLLFSLSNVIVFLMGFIILLGSWIDIADKFTYTGDYLFGYMADKFLSSSGSGGGNSIFFILLFLLAGAAVAAVIFALRSNGPMKQMVLARMAWSAMALVAIAFMGSQAQSNHMTLLKPGDTPTPIAIKMNSTTVNGVHSDLNVIGMLASDSNRDLENWAPLSPGWFVASVDELVNLASGFAVELVSTIGSMATLSDSRSVDDGNGNITVTTGISQPSTCDAYVAGVRQVFKSTALAGHIKGRQQVILQYDQIASNIYFENWRSAALGGSASARNSWCRAAETQSGRPPGEQAMVARVAGLYSEAVGKGGLGIADGNPSSIVNANGNLQTYANAEGGFVNADGSWRTTKFNELETSISEWLNGVGLNFDETVISRMMAASVFGPVYPNYDVSKDNDNQANGSGATKASFVWAMCNWSPGSDVIINPEWDNTLNANAGDRWTREDKQAACWDAVGREGPNSENFKKTLGHSKSSSPTFNYHEDGGFLGGLVFGLGSTSQYKNLGGSPLVMDYYLHIQGAKSGSSLFTSVIPLVLTISLIKYFGGILIGGFVAEFVSSMLMIVMFLALFIIVIPLKRCYAIAKNLGLTMLAAMVTTAFLSAILSAIFSLTKIFSALFRSTIPTNIDIVNSTLNGAGILIAFIVAHKLLNKTFGGNLSGMSGANTITRSSLSPIMRSLGGEVQHPPWSPDYWRDMTGRGSKASNASVSTDSEKGKEVDRTGASNSVFNGGENNSSSDSSGNTSTTAGSGKNGGKGGKKGGAIGGSLKSAGLNQVRNLANKSGIDPKEFMKDATGSWINKKTGVPVTDMQTKGVLDAFGFDRTAGINPDGSPMSKKQRMAQGLSGVVKPFMAGDASEKSMKQRMGEGFAGLVSPFMGPKSATPSASRSEDNQVLIPDAAFDPGQQGGPVSFQVNPDGEVSSVGAYGSGATSRTADEANDQIGKAITLVGSGMPSDRPSTETPLERSDAAINASDAMVTPARTTALNPDGTVDQVGTDANAANLRNSLLFSGTNSLGQRELEAGPSIIRPEDENPLVGSIIPESSGASARVDAATGDGASSIIQSGLGTEAAEGASQQSTPEAIPVRIMDTTPILDTLPFGGSAQSQPVQTSFTPETELAPNAGVPSTGDGFTPAMNNSAPVDNGDGEYRDPLELRPTRTGDTTGFEPTTFETPVDPLILTPTSARVITEQQKEATEDGRTALQSDIPRTPSDSEQLLTNMFSRLENSANVIEDKDTSDTLRDIASSVQNMRASTVRGEAPAVVPDAYIADVNSQINDAFNTLRNAQMTDNEFFHPGRGSVINSSMFDQETYQGRMPEQISTEIHNLRSWYNQSRSAGFDMTNTAHWPAEHRSSMDSIVRSMKDTFGEDFNDEYLIAGEVQASPAKKALRKLLSIRNRRQQ